MCESLEVSIAAKCDVRMEVQTVDAPDRRAELHCRFMKHVYGERTDCGML